MRNSLLEEVFETSVIDRVPEVTANGFVRFDEFASQLGLKPSSDFRFADLVGVDLSSSDLSTFDFTGADLRGAYGVNAKLDGAILTGATVGGSIFEYRQFRDKYFKEHPKASNTLKGLLSHHWTGATLWVAEQLKGRNAAEALEIAQALFLDTKDHFLRKQILFFLARSFRDRNSYYGFLLETLNRHGSDADIRQVVIESLANIFYHQQAVFSIIRSEIATAPAAQIPRLLAPLVRSKYAMPNLQALRRLVEERLGREGGALLARMLIQQLGNRYDLLMSERSIRDEINFDAMITKRSIERSAMKSNSARPTSSRARRESWDSERDPNYVLFKKAEFRHKIVQLVDELNDIGFGLKVED